jgi:hypothetical protein
MWSWNRKNNKIVGIKIRKVRWRGVKSRTAINLRKILKIKVKQWIISVDRGSNGINKKPQEWGLDRDGTIRWISCISDWKSWRNREVK